MKYRIIIHSNNTKETTELLFFAEEGSLVEIQRREGMGFLPGVRVSL